MPLDANIILQGNNNQIQPLDLYSKALNLRQLINQNRVTEQEQVQKNTMRDLLRNNVRTDENGNSNLDKNAVYNELMKTNPMQAIDLQKTFGDHDAYKLKQDTESMGQIFTNATPENYSSLRQKAIDMGIYNADKLPEQATLEIINGIKSRTLEIKDQIANQFKQVDSNKTKAETAKIYSEISNSKKQNKDLSFLPVENQEVIKDLARKNAEKLGIANQIDSVIGTWDSLTPDQKYFQGQALIKTMNSTEGKDAVGTDEREKLAGFLNFAYGNLTNQSPVGFGRHYDEFKKQALASSQNVRGAIKSNNDTINKMYSNSGISRDANSGFVNPNQSKITVSNGKENLQIDLSDLKHANADGYERVK